MKTNKSYSRGIGTYGYACHCTTKAGNDIVTYSNTSTFNAILRAARIAKERGSSIDRNPVFGPNKGWLWECIRDEWTVDANGKQILTDWGKHWLIDSNGVTSAKQAVEAWNDLILKNSVNIVMLGATK